VFGVLRTGATLGMDGKEDEQVLSMCMRKRKKKRKVYESIAEERVC